MCCIRLNRCFTKHHLFTQFTRNLIKNPFFLHHRLKMVSNQVVKYSNHRLRDSQAAAAATKKNEKKKNLGHGMIGILFHIKQPSLISWKVIWFELPKTNVCLLLFLASDDVQYGKKSWMCKTKLQLSEIAVWVEKTIPKEICRRLSDYKFHIHSLSRQLFIAEIYFHRAPKKRQCSKLSK